MKIAHIVSTFPPYYGGMGNVVFQTAEHLNRLGHEVEVFTPGYYPKSEIHESSEQSSREHPTEVAERIEYVRRMAPRLRYGNAAYLPQIGRELDAFDVVHLHYPFFGTANLVRKWKMKNLSKPLVITYHMDTRGTGWKGLVFTCYAAYWMDRILKSADALIGSSFDYIESSAAGEIYRREKEKWTELPFGVDTDRFAPRDKPREFFLRYGLDPSVPTLLFVGGMDKAHYFKGVPVLLDALLLVKKKGLRLQAILVGEGDLRAEFESRAAGYQLSDVRFTGSVTDMDLPLYYNMADLLALPSIHQGEAFGMVLLEAMASGVPAVASDLPGVRTVGQAGGLLVDPGSHEDLAGAIYGYFDSGNDRAAWSEKVRRIAEEKYSWEPIAVKLENIYKALVLGRKV